MVPTVKTIQTRMPKLTRDDANRVRRSLNACNRREDVRPALEEVSEIIGGYGVESIPRGHNQKSPAMLYANMGDPYTTTVIYLNGHFIIACWGDIVERGHYD